MAPEQLLLRRYALASQNINGTLALCKVLQELPLVQGLVSKAQSQQETNGLAPNRSEISSEGGYTEWGGTSTGLERWSEISRPRTETRKWPRTEPVRNLKEPQHNRTRTWGGISTGLEMASHRAGPKSQAKGVTLNGAFSYIRCAQR